MRFVRKRSRHVGSGGIVSTARPRALRNAIYYTVGSSPKSLSSIILRQLVLLKLLSASKSPYLITHCMSI